MTKNVIEWRSQFFKDIPQNSVLKYRESGNIFAKWEFRGWNQLVRMAKDGEIIFEYGQCVQADDDEFEMHYYSDRGDHVSICVDDINRKIFCPEWITPLGFEIECILVLE